MNPTEFGVRILEVAAAHSSRRLTIEELAVKADTTPARIYKKLQDLEFRELFIETMKTSLLGDVPEILNSFVGLAKAGSFKHGKLVLQVAQIYEDKKTLTANVHVDAVPFKNDEDRRAFLAATVGELVSGGDSDDDSDDDTDD